MFQGRTGTPKSMHPRILSRQKYKRVDELWSIGTLIFLCATGHEAFSINANKRSDNDIQRMFVFFFYVARN